MLLVQYIIQDKKSTEQTQTFVLYHIPYTLTLPLLFPSTQIPGFVPQPNAALPAIGMPVPEPPHRPPEPEGLLTTLEVSELKMQCHGNSSTGNTDR